MNREYRVWKSFSLSERILSWSKTSAGLVKLGGDGDGDGMEKSMTESPP